MLPWGPTFRSLGRVRLGFACGRAVNLVVARSGSVCRRLSGREQGGEGRLNAEGGSWAWLMSGVGTKGRS